MDRMTDERLRLHLKSWLGRWPAQSLVDVVGSVRRTSPGWDGRVFSLVGVGAPDAAVLSVPPENATPIGSPSGTEATQRRTTCAAAPM